MERNHMLAPAPHRETVSAGSPPHDAVLNPPPPPATLPHPHAHPSPAALAFSPPAYSQPAGAPIRLPDLSSIDHKSHNDSHRTLPSLSSLTGAVPQRADMAVNPSATHWPGIAPMTAYYPHQLQSVESPATMDLDRSSNGTMSATSPDRYLDGRSSSVNLDDPDVRLAAEALGDLKADLVSSPQNSNSALLKSPPAVLTRPQTPQPEPLLSLLTTSHPFLATTIEGASSAYGGAKNFSPRFKSGAEYVEGYLTPIANTVGSVGRVTGVEGGVRWFLGEGRRPPHSSSDLEAGGGSKKRRKVDNGIEPVSNKRLEGDDGMKHALVCPATSIEAGCFQDSFPPTPKGDRRLSLASTVDTLPAYDEMRSPAYSETVDSQSTTGRTPAPNAAWQSRLIMSTSGLSIAMSNESLRSLKYCLRWLRWANQHMGHVIDSLKTTLEQYENTGRPEKSQTEVAEKEQNVAVSERQVAQQPVEPSRTELAARINTLKGDVLKTLQDVINNVSKYAGGALPENARVLVRRHLTSLPQRFRVATMSRNNTEGGSEDSEGAMREGAQKVLVLAKEGLDMVTQVSGVLDGTIVSAEEWCERMGRKTRESRDDDQPVLPQTEPNGDVKMG